MRVAMGSVKIINEGRMYAISLRTISVETPCTTSNSATRVISLVSSTNNNPPMAKENGRHNSDKIYRLSVRERIKTCDGKTRMLIHANGLKT
jgi:hypothetical protein